MSKRLLRSLLSLMVCMAMLLSLTPAVLAESADAPSTEMAVGALIHGFEVVENGEFALLNAKTTVLRHQKTGATVFFLINEDTNRAFDISGHDDLPRCVPVGSAAAQVCGFLP